MPNMPSPADVMERRGSGCRGCNLSRCPSSGQGRLVGQVTNDVDDDSSSSSMPTSTATTERLPGGGTGVAIDCEIARLKDGEKLFPFEYLLYAN